MANKNLAEKLKKIKLLVFDVDGVLTDGKIYLSDIGETKTFYCKDAVRIHIALNSGLKVLLFTARKCAAVERRSKEMNVDLLFKNDLRLSGEKLLDFVKKKFGVKPDEILYAGDDWNDIYLMKQAGVAIAPQNASVENKKVAHIITKARGGEGAIAEIIEILMRVQGTWKKYFENYLKNTEVN